MQAVGFVLCCIGVTIAFGAKRIVMGKVKLQEQDKKEIELLSQGAILAVKIVGFVVLAVGFIFIIIQ